MIIARAPLRITLGGGGTDLPWFVEKHGGFCLTAAIQQYVYITIHETFVKRLILKYSQIEEAYTLDNIRHPLFRETLRLYHENIEGLEIASMADIPAGTGLGSSSTFTVALVKALFAHNQADIDKKGVAAASAFIEVDVLHEPIGKQDHYASALGGVRSLRFSSDGKVYATRPEFSYEVLNELEENLCLFFTGYSRSASELLATQRDKRDDAATITNLTETKHVGEQTYNALMSGDMDLFAELLNYQWRLKYSRDTNTLNYDIRSWYKLGLNNGALGGKLIGAGGGGFLMFYAKDKSSLRKVMKDAGLPEISCRFDYLGAQVVYTT